MADSASSEARLQRALDALRREIREFMNPPRVRDTFEETIQSAMAALRKLLRMG